ncbi:MAG: hypothetical protein AB8B64_05775 [Granulosicoccus sp.]
MSGFLKSRRLRKKSIVRWTLLIALLAFFIAQVRPVEGVTTPVLVGSITAAAFLVMVFVHVILNIMHGGRRKRRMLPTPARNYSSFTDTNFHEFKDRTPSHLGTTSRIATPESLDKPQAPSEGVLVESTTTAEKRPDVPAQLSYQIIEDPTAEQAPSDKSIDMDATSTTPEILQMQVKRVGDLVQSHNLGNISSIRDAELSKHNDSSHEQKRLTLVKNDLISKPGFSDTADPTKMGHSEIVELVALLRKDKARLHRLVIAQQTEIDSEREMGETTRTIARDAFKSIRDLRKIQKNTEKQVRRERAERKRIEEEYERVSQALENAKSIISAQATAQGGQEPAKMS